MDLGQQKAKTQVLEVFRLASSLVSPHHRTAKRQISKPLSRFEPTAKQKQEEEQSSPSTISVVATVAYDRGHDQEQVTYGTLLFAQVPLRFCSLLL